MPHRLRRLRLLRLAPTPPPRSPTAPTPSKSAPPTPPATPTRPRPALLHRRHHPRDDDRLRPLGPDQRPDPHLRLLLQRARRQLPMPDRLRRLRLLPSPLTAAPLTDGAHSFEVRATDAAANTDPTPAQRSFTVDTTAPTSAAASPRPPTRPRSRSPTPPPMPARGWPRSSSGPKPPAPGPTPKPPPTPPRAPRAPSPTQPPPARAPTASTPAPSTKPPTRARPLLPGLQHPARRTCRTEHQSARHPPDGNVPDYRNRGPPGPPASTRLDGLQLRRGSTTSGGPGRRSSR